MSDPTEQRRSAPDAWRIVLDEGEQLRVRPAPPGARAEVELRLPASRAVDLAGVLAAYTRMAALMAESSAISGTEDSLARALKDAAVVATGRQPAEEGDLRVTTTGRLRAMALLQEVRPQFSHSKLVSVIDAAAWWLEAGQDFMASDLLDAVADEEHGSVLHRTLLQGDAPTGTSAAGSRR